MATTTLESALGEIKKTFVPNPNYVPVNQAQASASSQVPLSPITPDSLQPATPLKLPTSPVGSEADGFGGWMEGLAQTTAANREDAGFSFEKLVASLDATEGEAGLTDRAYSVAGGADDLEKEVNSLSAELAGEQHSLRREIERIEDNKEGLFGPAVADKVDEAKRKSYRKQADIAVVLNAKNGQFDTAKKIADRAVAVQLEKDIKKNELLKFIYQENKEQYTKAEQRQFEAEAKERDRVLDNKEYRLRAEFDAKIKQADPLYQAQLANAQGALLKTRQEINAAVTNTPMKMARQKATIDGLTDIASNPTISSAVGPNVFARGAISGLTGAKQNFIAGVEQLRSQLTIENLLQAKAQGAAFGGLSDGERQELAAAASKLGTWANKNSSGEVTGYSVDEASFRAEIDKINNFAKLDYVLRGGNPAEVGVQIMPDNTMWTRNSDGSFQQLQ